ncbi:MAG: hypothetical protein AAFV86_19505 [Pseudomonadota bacterium]
MWRRLWRQRRRLAITTLLAAPLFALSHSGNDDLLPVLAGNAVMVLVFIGVAILAWPTGRRSSTGLIAVAFSLAVIDLSALGGILPGWVRILLIVAAALVLPRLFHRLVDAVVPRVRATLAAEVTVPLDPVATLERYTGRDGTNWSPVLARVEHRADGYDRVYRDGFFDGMVARHDVCDYVPGQREVSRVTMVSPDERVDGGHAEVTLTVRPVPGGTRLSMAERSEGLAPSIMAGAWQDDAVGATLDQFAAFVSGRRDRSTLAADYRAVGIDTDPPDRAF